MPNWCYTSYVVTGDSTEVYDLYKKMKSLEDREESLIPNGFGKRWLGNLVSILGGDWQKVRCRGDWDNLDISNDGGELKFNTESAWAEPYEVIDFLRKHYPNIHFYFQAEEAGCGYYVTNDSEGIYFPERYSVDVYDKGLEYYETEEEVLAVLSNLLNVEIDSIDKAESEVEKYNDSHDEEYIYVNVIEVI